MKGLKKKAESRGVSDEHAADKDTTWQAIETAPEGIEILTKIDDHYGSRNEQVLIYRNGLFWTGRRGMYVYYTPTHWKPLEKQKVP